MAENLNLYTYLKNKIIEPTRTGFADNYQRHKKIGKHSAEQLDT